MNHLCPTKARCTGTDTPFANLSSELPDQDLFIGSNFGWDLNIPRLGWKWDDLGGVDFCEAPTQAEADLCAQNGQLGNQTGPFPAGHWTNQNGTPIQVVSNQQVSCSSTCPDGTLFTWTIAPGRYTALSQTQANQMAQSDACKLAVINRICVSNAPSVICQNQARVFFLSVTGGVAPFSFQLTSGVLPTGMFLQQLGPRLVQISGTPTTAGNYTFQLTAIDANGNFMTKQFTVAVLGLVSTTMPNATQNVSYSQAMQGAGGTAPYTFAAVTGLPAGLTLSSSGVLSGTPTLAETSFFDIAITDAKGNTCTLSVDLTIDAPACTFFAGLVWDAPPDQQISPHGTAIESFPTAQSVQADLTCILAGIGQPSILSNTNANVPLVVDAAEVTCKVSITISNLVGFNSERVFVSDSLFNVFYLDTGNVSFAAGTHDFTFTKPAGVTAICVSYSVQCADGTIGVENAAIRMVVVFGA